MIKHLTKSKEYILSSFSVQYLIMLNSVILHQALAKYGPQAQYGPSGFVIWPIDHCYKGIHMALASQILLLIVSQRPKTFAQSWSAPLPSHSEAHSDYRQTDMSSHSTLGSDS